MSGAASKAGAFPRLLSPLKVGAHTLRNRVIMASMHTRLELMDRSVERETAYYAERARGGVALIITSGYSPNAEGLIEEGSHVLDSRDQIPAHRPVVDAVHAGGAKFVLQILHSGRYAKHDRIVGPSSVRSPINPRVPRPMTEADIERTIQDYVRCAELAGEAGYDGVEVMASEGYLINQFTATRTNDRTDRWGGSCENRVRLAQSIVAGIRQRMGPEFLILYRISAADFVEGGRSTEDIAFEARTVAAAGADALDTGVGWHEARVPTIAYQVPRAAFAFATARLKQAVQIPVIACNRINMPDVAEGVLERGEADLIAMARPMLADPHFVRKAAEGRVDEINTCIACNQACLDMIFGKGAATCLVNPKAAREIEFDERPPARRVRVAVVGSGPAGMSCAINAAERGHSVVLFEAADDVGGQLHLARRIPGKDEFNELMRYFRRQLARTGVEVRTGVRVDAAQLAKGFDRVVVATGIEPRVPDIPGIEHPKVLRYEDVILGRKVPGRKVAIIGTGGIGYDVAEMLTHEASSVPEPQRFFAEWGVDPTMSEPGALKPAVPAHSPRQVVMLQRSTDRPGARLGVSTGWVLRARLQKAGVTTLVGCRYLGIDDRGLRVFADGREQILDVDNVVLCAGQEPANALSRALTAAGVAHEVIGGARLATELDAFRAIGEGARLAYAF